MYFQVDYRMRVHLENKQNIVFEEGIEANAVEAAAGTVLTAFFNINAFDYEEKDSNVQNRPKRWMKYDNMPSWGTGATCGPVRCGSPVSAKATPSAGSTPSSWAVGKSSNSAYSSTTRTAWERLV